MGGGVVGKWKGEKMKKTREEFEWYLDDLQELLAQEQISLEECQQPDYDPGCDEEERANCIAGDIEGHEEEIHELEKEIRKVRRKLEKLTIQGG